MHEILAKVDMNNPSYESWNQTTIMTLMHILIHRKIAVDFSNKVVDAGQDDVDRSYELLKGYLEWNYKTPPEERQKLAKVAGDKLADGMNMHMARMQYFQKLKPGDSVLFKGMRCMITKSAYVTNDGWWFNLMGFDNTQVSVHDCDPIGEHEETVQVLPGKFRKFTVKAKEK